MGAWWGKGVKKASGDGEWAASMHPRPPAGEQAGAAEAAGHAKGESTRHPGHDTGQHNKAIPSASRKSPCSADSRWTNPVPRAQVRKPWVGRRGQRPRRKGGLGTADSTNSSPCQAPFFPCRSHRARWHSCLPNAQTAEEGKLACPGSHEIHGIPQPHIFLSPHAPVDFDTWPHTSTKGRIPVTETQAWPCLPL